MAPNTRQRNKGLKKNAPVNVDNTVTNLPTISLKELAQHREPQNAWISYRGKVFDVSNWHDHPGGSVIFTHAGDDATDIFTAFHPASAIKEMDKFLIGELDASDVAATKSQDQVNFEKAYRTLRAQLLQQGYFNSSPLYYVKKVSTNLALLALAVYLAVSTDSLAINLVGACVLALFWQQCGWLAHDFLHHQVFKNRLYGDLMGFLIGNVFQGFSVGWWKTKHNAHHSVPNLHSSSPEAVDGDPDIDTMPLLAWTKKMASFGHGSKVAKFLISWQAITYFPILGLARMSWLRESFKYVFSTAGYSHIQKDQVRTRLPLVEKLGLILHYIGLIAILYNMPGGVVNASLYFLTSQIVCGIFLALVFGLGHNGMAVYPADMRPDFWKLQVTTTRNVTPNWFVNWFCGGLQYQVDHHLFPLIPRHNLAKIHPAVDQLCKDHGLVCHTTTMAAGTVEVLSHLNDVAIEFLTEFPAM